MALWFLKHSALSDSSQPLHLSCDIREMPNKVFQTQLSTAVFLETEFLFTPLSDSLPALIAVLICSV